MSHERLSVRINDPEVKKRLAAYKERNRIKKLQEEYDELFKDSEPNIGDKFWETDIDVLPSLFDNSSISYGDIRNRKTNNRIVNQMLERQGVNQSVVTSNINRRNRALNRVHTLDEAISRLDSSIAIGPQLRENRSEPKDPFYMKIWFKVGIPSGITFIASFAELWRAFH